MIFSNLRMDKISMNSQEEWARRWKEVYSWMPFDSEIYVSYPEFLDVDLRTMIYAQPEAEGLADQAVETAEASAKAEEKEPLSEDEKARLWRAVLESCSG